MIRPDSFLMNADTASLLDLFSNHSSVPENNAIFFGEEFVLSADMICRFLFFTGPEFALEVFSIRIYKQLIYIVCIIPKSVVKIIVDYTRSSTKRYLPLVVRE